MKNQTEKLDKKEKEKIEINQNEDISEVSDENSENGEQEEDPGNNINVASFITTPYERVLSIINEAKAFILSISKSQQKLIKGLDWAIKVIASHSLYSYELKDQEYLNQMSEENPEFKQFVEFVNRYNDEVIQMNKKINIMGGKTFQKSSLNLKRENAPRYIQTEVNKEKGKETKETNKNTENGAGVKNEKNILNKERNKKDAFLKKYKNKSFTNEGKYSGYKNKSKNLSIKLVNESKNSKNLRISIREKTSPNKNKNNENKVKSPQPKKVIDSPRFKRLQTDGRIKNNNNIIIKSISGKFRNKSVNIENNDVMHKNFKKESPRFLNEQNYPKSRILDKSFNIFELKEYVGYEKALPYVGKVILDAFGLNVDEIIATEKLEPFLISVSNQYLKTTLYHNSLHGADVTQSVGIFFLNSNAEEICQSLVLDLLGILISALGHDLGHPGFTNPFHINSSSDLAITYNDASCLENFHASKLFRIIRNPATDIFEKLSVQDYKTIRKRIIGNILATDMVNHGKIMTVIKSRISINQAENKEQFELLSGNETTKFEEQQSLFDLLIHCADLAHNTKLFKISIKWVELLQEEFWLQGDKEKSLNLPVSFLCDRENYNVPKSQVGFLKGFILPTFDCLSTIFPSLKYCLINAKTNVNRWQKLANKGRLKGWTPDKNKKINYKKKIILFNAISLLNDDPNTPNIKRRAGNVNSLSHELQVKELKIEKKEENEKLSNDNKRKIAKPNFITKTKNHDKKIHINKFQKIK